MAKNQKKEVKVKELPKGAKKLAAKDMKKVRGGDYNGDGIGLPPELTGRARRPNFATVIMASVAPQPLN